MGDTDIENFIAQQKAKLAVERQTLNDSKMYSTDYQRQWQQHHTGPGGPRKTWGAPTDVKLSPRGTLDTDAIINHVQREKAKEEYETQWRQFHQTEQTTPRAPVTMTGGQKLDTDRIIRNVTKENRGDDGYRRKRADADSGLKNLNPANISNPILGRDDYQQVWKDTKTQQFTPRGGNLATSPGGGLLIKDDGREGRIKRMEQDRNKEYNDLMANKRVNNSSLKDQTDEFKAGTLPGNESDSVKWQQRKQRNDEYNAYLAQRNPRARFDEKKQGLKENISSLPRLNYSTSAQRRKNEEERNREYNEMLMQKGQGGSRPRGGGPPNDVRTGWGTPDYGDILARQRAKEQNFRRANDIAYEADPVTRQNNPNGPPSVRRSKDQGGEYFASLPLGYSYNKPVIFNGRNTDSAQQRQKNRYGDELKMQMAEAAQARQIERKEGLLINNNSVVGPGVGRPVGGAPMAAPKGGDPYYTYLKNLPDYDELSPRSNAILGRRQPTSERLRNKGGLNPSITPRGERGDSGILDLGLFNQPRNTSLDPPAGLVYQPS